MNDPGEQGNPVRLYTEEKYPWFLPGLAEYAIEGQEIFPL